MLKNVNCENPDSVFFNSVISAIQRASECVFDMGGISTVSTTLRNNTRLYILLEVGK
jgi:hypothetical protein